MDDIRNYLEDADKLETPLNQLGMPDYLRTKIGILRSVVEKLNKMIQMLEDNLRDWEEYI